MRRNPPVRTGYGISNLSTDYETVKRLGDYGYYPYNHITFKRACGEGELPTVYKDDEPDSENLWKDLGKPPAGERYSHAEQKKSELWFAKMYHCSLLNFKGAYAYVEPMWVGENNVKEKRLKYPMHKALLMSFQDMIEGDDIVPAMHVEPGIEQSLFEMYRTIWECKVLETEPERFAKIEVALLKRVLEKHCTSRIGVHAVNGETRIDGRPKPIYYTSPLDYETYGGGWPWDEWFPSSVYQEEMDETNYDMEDDDEDRPPLVIDENVPDLLIPARSSYIKGELTPTEEKSAIFNDN